MSDDAKRVLGEVDELIARGHRQQRMARARERAFVEGHDPELAATAAAVERRPPALLAGEAPGVSSDGHQNPTIRRRVERIRAAMAEGRVTPAEGPRILAAMAADEQAATKLLDAMPADRVPLEAKAWVPDPENPLGVIEPGGMLPAHMSLLSAHERAAVAARRSREHPVES